MSNYFADFIRRFGGDKLGLTATADPVTEKSARPCIKYLTLYNPLWVPQNDESLHSLAKQILFFIKPGAETKGDQSSSNTAEEDGTVESGKDAELEERLNIIGLIRGSSSLAADFGHSTQAVFIHISDGVILVVEIEKDYFLSVYLSGRCGQDASKDIYGKQLEIMLEEWHATFKLFHLTFNKLRTMHGDSAFKLMLKNHWESFMSLYNCGSEPHFGPADLRWPNRTNSQGFFRFFPENSYKLSSIKLSDTHAAKLANMVSGGNGSPSAMLVANVSKDTPKKRGIISFHCQEALDEDEVRPQMLRIYEIFECLDANGCCEAKAISPRVESIYAAMKGKWQKESQDLRAVDVQPDLEDDEVADASMISYAATMEALNPATLTNKLLVLPINDTINGFKYLGLAVSDQITAPSWLHAWGEPAPNAPDVEDVCLELDSSNGEFLVGLVGDDVTRLLINMRLTTSDETTEAVEMLLVVFLEEETLVILAYESGMEQLGNRTFYTDLQSGILEEVTELSKSLHMLMGNSIGSLRDSIGINIRDGNAGTLHEEIESGFFYIVYDLETKSYRSSLPALATVLRPQQPVTGNKRWAYKTIFHLHDRLMAHFVCKHTGRVFSTTNVATESLHKFSSRKSGDWMFYLIRQEKKIIIIIKGTNSKRKARPTLESEDNYLAKVTESIYGAANLGFLDSLGEDVKIWLGGLSEGKLS